MPTDSDTVPFPNSYWVVPGYLLAGEYPIGHDPNQALNRISRILQAGITSFIDLTQIGEAPLYSMLLNNIPSKDEVNYKHFHQPIKDFSIPTVKFMKDTLDLLDELISAGTKTYIHCLGGIGRTGTVVGCYLVRHGRKPNEALDWLTYLRRNTPDWWYSSPESTAQKDMILNWRIGQ